MKPWQLVGLIASYLLLVWLLGGSGSLGDRGTIVQSVLAVLALLVTFYLDAEASKSTQDANEQLKTQITVMREQERTLRAQLDIERTPNLVPTTIGTSRDVIVLYNIGKHLVHIQSVHVHLGSGEQITMSWAHIPQNMVEPGGRTSLVPYTYHAENPPGTPGFTGRVPEGPVQGSLSGLATVTVSYLYATTGLTVHTLVLHVDRVDGRVMLQRAETVTTLPQVVA